MRNNKIYPTPPLPKTIVEAVNHENLAIFIGAGVSRLIGCMGWADLAKNLVERCFRTRRKDGPTCINYKEKETLSQGRNHKKTITICYHILERNGFVDIFFEELEKSLEADKGLLQSQNIYDELYGLRGLFITTNADKHFHGRFDPHRIAYQKEDFNPSNIDRLKLYHIHGSILDRNSLVFTVPQYIQRYNHPQFKEFLEKIFDEYVVLFVGYGMAEFELLDFLIAKFDSEKGKELKHFIISGYFRDEENILDLEQFYYNSMGISVLAYEKDERGHNQLYEVLKSWNAEINQISTYLYDTYQEIEEVANNYDKNKADRVFQVIKNDEPQENHFFKKLASSSDPFPWLRPLKKKEYFSPTNNPQPQEVSGQEGCFTIPCWNVLGYLENVATQNAQNPSDEITELLLDIVNSISNYRNEAGQRIDNDRTDWVIIKIIFALPLDKISTDHIDFIATSLKSKWGATLVPGEIGKTVFPKLIKDEAKGLLLRLIEVILEYQKTDKDITEKYISVMDKHWLEKALRKHKPVIGRLCGIEAAEIGLKKMLAITNENKSQFNPILIPTVEDHPQTTFTDVYECQLVQFVRDMFELSEPNLVKAKIAELLREEHPIYKRIAIHTINHHYKELNELFWKLKTNPIDDFVKHELYELLKFNCSSFSKEQVEKVLGWIESATYYVSDGIRGKEELVEKILAYEKKEWLSALLETKHADVLSSYEKYHQIDPTELEHPGFDSWTESRWGTISPIAGVELLNKSNEEIADYLINFKEEQGWEKPTYRGLSDSLRNCVSENPVKFANDMKPFLSAQRLCQHALLCGFSEAWRAKKVFPWHGVLDFMSQIVESVEFWNEKYEEGSYNYRNWIVSQIAELINEGTRNDKHAFDATLLPAAENILLTLVEKAESDISEAGGLVTAVLNSSRGNIFSAMINYSLRCARLSKKGGGKRWIQAIKENFDKRLDRDVEPSLEFSVILGQYLENLYFLDKTWVTTNINRVFPKDNDKHWKAAFIGYLFYSSVVRKELYSLLRENAHYAKALQTDFNESRITERLIQHICLGYIEGLEKLDDSTSLISKLIRNKSVEQLLAIVSFFSMQEDKTTQKIKAKVKPLWKTLFDIASQNKENPEYQRVISYLSGWLSLIDDIDEQTLHWLKLSAKYIQIDHNVTFFIESLLKHAPKTPEKVGKIYLEMLNADIYPDYKEADIQEIVRILYEKNQKVTADRICVMYAAKGFDFLKSLYDKHSNNSR